MRPGLAALAALVVVGCGPSSSTEQAEICAILALPGVPGDTQVGDADDLALGLARERTLLASGTIYGPGWRSMARGRSWGRCAIRAKPVEMLLVSPDRTYAMTKGGRRADGRPVTFGTCYYDKDHGGWRLRACRRSLDAPAG